MDLCAISSICPNRIGKIRAKVLSKTQIKMWSHILSDGQVARFSLLDESGEITALAFTEELERFYDAIKIDTFYLICDFLVKPAAQPNVHEFEIVLTGRTKISHLNGRSITPFSDFRFHTVHVIQETARNIVDFIGICKDKGDIMYVNARESKNMLSKRQVVLVDINGDTISLVLWQQNATNFAAIVGDVLAIGRAKVTVYNGRKQLSLVSSTSIFCNPDIKACKDLKNSIWMSKCIEPVARARDTSSFLDVRELKTKATPGSTFTLIATLIGFNRNIAYKACPTPACNKRKLLVSGGTVFLCTRCDTYPDSFHWQLNLQMKVGDCSGYVWVTAFNKVAEALIGDSADSIGKMTEQSYRNAEVLMQRLMYRRLTCQIKAIYTVSTE